MNATGNAVNEQVDKTENKDLNGTEPDYEALASGIGWAPKDKFRGDPSKHLDAKTYYEKGEFVLPIVKKQRDEFKAHAEKSDKTIAELKSAMADFQKFTEAAAERKVTDLKSEIASLKDARAEAVASGDKEAFRQADKAIDERTEALDKAKEAKVEAKEQPKTGDPEFEAWVKDNDWYTKDAKRRRLANAIGLDLTAENPDLKGKALFKAVSEEMERIEAEKSGTERAGPQRGGKASGSNSKAKTFDNLLPEYKQAFTRFEKNGIKMTKEQYMANCDSDAWGA